MRAIIVSLLIALLVFGCTGPSAPGTPASPGIVPDEEVEACTFDSSFSGPADGVFGGTEKLTGSVTCAAGQQLELSVDGEVVDTMAISDNATTTVSFDVPGVKVGALEVTVASAGVTLYTTEWNVGILGNDDVSGADFDSLSFKQWRAMAFDIEAPVEVGRVSAYMKRLEGKTQPNTNLLVEIRKDASGEPGSLVDSVAIPMAETTLSYNWIHFDFEQPAQLQKGRYWIVVQVEQTENILLVSDAVMLHYTTNDRLAEGNDYTRQMDLSIDQKTGYASETTWEPLSFDREYNIVIRD